MTFSDLLDHIAGMLDDAPDHAEGMLDLIAGAFDESQCADAGRVAESDYCEGARDARQLLADRPLASRRLHGSSA